MDIKIKILKILRRICIFPIAFTVVYTALMVFIEIDGYYPCPLTGIEEFIISIVFFTILPIVVTVGFISLVFVETGFGPLTTGLQEFTASIIQEFLVSITLFIEQFFWIYIVSVIGILVTSILIFIINRKNQRIHEKEFQKKLVSNESD